MTAPSARTADPLPRPTGPHEVGRTTLDFVDESHVDRYAHDPGTPRALVLWIWYPAASDADSPRAEYLPTPWGPTGQFLGVDASGVQTHAVTDAPIVQSDARLPVLLLSPMGFPPLFLSAIAEELASAGNVVVGVNHTYETSVTVFADGNIVQMNPDAIGGALGPNTGDYKQVFAERGEVCEYKAADLASVANHLERLDTTPVGLAAEMLDFTRIAALGHSMGGNAALEWCRGDTRCKAAVNLDGALWSTVGSVGVPRPVLQILTPHPEFEMNGEQAVAAGITQDPAWHDAERALAFDGWRTVERTGEPACTVQVSGATHMSFMDLPFLPLSDDSPARAMLSQTSIDATRMWRLTSDLLLAFFAEHRDGAASTITTIIDGAPEVSRGAP
jgi:predicted dienelactone hydrolase